MAWQKSPKNDYPDTETTFYQQNIRFPVQNMDFRINTTNWRARLLTKKQEKKQLFKTIVNEIA